MFSMRWDLIKGHGTENDFLLLPDFAGELELTGELVRDLCQRRSGLGADGFIKVVRTAACPEVAHLAGAATWFMDYRNADGSIAEMCGNGLRVFLAYLVNSGQLTAGAHQVATRAGALQVRVSAEQSPGRITAAVNLGQWRLGADSSVGDCQVALPGHVQTWPGISVQVGNPHTVVLLPQGTSLADLDLTRAPVVTPAPTGGSNVEFVVTRPGPGAGQAALDLRVFERGVGETRSCGTGAAAAALAARAITGASAADWHVRVPGGELQVNCTGGLTSGQEVWLSGPAVLVATAQVPYPMGPVVWSPEGPESH